MYFAEQESSNSMPAALSNIKLEIAAHFQYTAVSYNTSLKDKHCNHKPFFIQVAFKMENA